MIVKKLNFVEEEKTQSVRNSTFHLTIRLNHSRKFITLGSCADRMYGEVMCLERTMVAGVGRGAGADNEFICWGAALDSPRETICCSLTVAR